MRGHFLHATHTKAEDFSDIGSANPAHPSFLSFRVRRKNGAQQGRRVVMAPPLRLASLPAPTRRVRQRG